MSPSNIGLAGRNWVGIPDASSRPTPVDARLTVPEQRATVGSLDPHNDGLAPGASRFVSTIVTCPALCRYTAKKTDSTRDYIATVAGFNIYSYSLKAVT